MQPITDQLSNTALIDLERQLRGAIQLRSTPGPLTARRLLTEDLPHALEVVRELRQARAELAASHALREQMERRLTGLLSALKMQAADPNGLLAAIEVWSGRTARGVPFQSWPPAVRPLYDELVAAEAILRTK